MITKRNPPIFLLLYLIICVVSQHALADGPAVQWEKTFGGSKGDSGSSVQQTSDGGFIVTGRTYSSGAGKYYVYLIKTNPNGDSLWQKTFGGSSRDGGYSVQQTTDGGFIIAGVTYIEYEDAYLIKTDTNGNLLWQKTFGGRYDDGGYSAQQTSDGGYIIAGRTWSFGTGDGDVYLIKTDPNGDSLWQKTFGGYSDDGGWSVQETTDGGFIITGYTSSFGTGDRDVYLIKTDPNGTFLWQKTFGGSDADYGYSVQETTDGGYIIAGKTDSFGDPNGDIYLIKTDSTGNLLWQKTFGGSRYDAGDSVQQTTDGGFIIAGVINFGGGSNVYLIKTDPNGDRQWQKTFGGNGDDWGCSVQQTFEGGFIIAGWTYSGNFTDVYLIKLAALIVGDLDYDGDVDNDDLALSKQKWLNTDCIPGNNWCSGADFDRDGDVDFVDFAKFAQHWLEGTTP